MTDTLDEKFMRLALKEAKKGFGRTSPNPCVGAVIVKSGRVIGKGYHKRAGTPHAEIHALQNVSDSPLDSTMYVTLEPCNHMGKTGPCSHAIVQAGISRVVVGMTDPNPLVDGSGIGYLKQNSIEVISGILKKQCEEINRPFVKWITQGVPWVIMKAGVSLDGKLNYQRGKSGWITGEKSLREVHKLRNSVDAILVGRGTVQIDNPSLTTRLQNRKTRDPIRIILDSSLSATLDSKVYHLDSRALTWVFCGVDAPKVKMLKLQNLGVKVTPVECGEIGLHLHQVIKILGKANICSLLVEGGARLHGAFLNEKLVDWCQLFYGTLFAGDQGVALIEGYSAGQRRKAPCLVDAISRRLGDDFLISGKLSYPE